MVFRLGLCRYHNPSCAFVGNSHSINKYISYVLIVTNACRMSTGTGQQVPVAMCQALVRAAANGNVGILLDWNDWLPRALFWLS